MRSASSAQERPARNVPTAGFNCAKIMWKHVADATRSSARPAFSSVQRSTPKLHRQTTGKFENERPPSPHPASQPLTVKGLSATDGPFTGPAHRTIVIHLSWDCSVVGVPNSHRIGTLHCFTSDSLDRYRGVNRRMQKNLRLDWLLWGSIALLAFSPSSGLPTFCCRRTSLFQDSVSLWQWCGRVGKSP